MPYEHISDFDYLLPDRLIAQYPLESRSDSRLLFVNTAQVSIGHNRFTDILELLNPNDLLVVNNTKVFPARLRGKKDSGAAVECLVERILSDQRALVHLRSNRSPKPQNQLLFAEALSAEVISRVGELFLLDFHCKQPLSTVLQRLGEVPLPPYIDRGATAEDQTRYQTVYARHLGAVAAPTAGLHFTPELMEVIRLRGINIGEITLHVGTGTFQPVRVEQLDRHQMHREYFEVSEEACSLIRQCQQAGGRIIAVGTTTLRALETVAAGGGIHPYRGETALFIRPGYVFQCVNGLITNFHLPKSSLLMLVTAFGGYELVMRAYQEAITADYRFYSYGDAMLII